MLFMNRVLAGVLLITTTADRLELLQQAANAGSLTPFMCAAAADVGGFHKAYELSNYGLAGEHCRSISYCDGTCVADTCRLSCLLACCSCRASGRHVQQGTRGLCWRGSAVLCVLNS